MRETPALESRHGSQFTLSTQFIKLIFREPLPHRRSTAVSLETNPLFHTNFQKNSEL